MALELLDQWLLINLSISPPSEEFRLSLPSVIIYGASLAINNNSHEILSLMPVARKAALWAFIEKWQLPAARWSYLPPIDMRTRPCSKVVSRPPGTEVQRSAAAPHSSHQWLYITEFRRSMCFYCIASSLWSTWAPAAGPSIHISPAVFTVMKHSDAGRQPLILLWERFLSDIS